MTNFTNTNPFSQYNNSLISTNPVPTSQLSYKPITFEKLSSLIGTAYTLSNLENINTIASPRGSEQQILFINNDNKIYVRNFDNSMGIIGYKESYVQQLEQELAEAQTQLQQIFQEFMAEESKETTEQSIKNKDDDRLNKIEEELTQLKNFIAELMIKEEQDEFKGNS